MKNTPLEYKLIGISEPVLKDLGFDLVLLEFKGGVLQILAENSTTGNLTLDDCSAISKALSPVLEVDDPISGAYTLEVSSPGIDRPLVRADDFGRYTGFDAKLELDDAIEDGRKRFRGKLTGVKDGFVSMIVDNEEHRFEMAAIKKARLVLTDDLIKATKKKETVTN